MNQLAVEKLPVVALEAKKHQLPPLGYDYGALEPCIDARTMMLHHVIHHAAYVDKLNLALEKFPELFDFTPLWLLRNLDKVPAEIRDEVRHNAGGHINHGLFWRAMKPAVSGHASEPKGALREAIIRDFGTVAAFKAVFDAAGEKQFASGWVWLARTRQADGKLEVITTSGHDHPAMQDRFPILLNDVWEHAYYLRYENRRADYLKGWWSVVDWQEAARRFDLADNSAEVQWEGEGGQILPGKE